MVIADTSVWVEHLRRGDARLTAELNAGHVAMHPFVVGELACGNLRKRGEILGLLLELPVATSVTDSEVLEFIEKRRLMGRGIGLVDAHLLASAILGGMRLLTYDRRLASLTAELNL